jgi:hypothetical protein
VVTVEIQQQLRLTQLLQEIFGMAFDGTLATLAATGVGIKKLVQEMTRSSTQLQHLWMV